MIEESAKKENKFAVKFDKKCVETNIDKCLNEIADKRHVQHAFFTSNVQNPLAASQCRRLPIKTIKI